MNGIINVYKEEGYTSHDVVAKLRGILKTKKIGHTGTLDPMARGVLPVCVGKATKLCEFMLEKEKEYYVVMRLGARSDTGDMTGNITESCINDLLKVGEEQAVHEAIGLFVGDIKQIPPMYSALKVNGKKLYELARPGKTVEREPRNVTIYSIDITRIDLSNGIVEFGTRVSKGTYIRSLCSDIGDKLGCGALMQSLVRTKSGIFDIDNALKLDEIEKLNAEGKLSEHVISIEDVFAMRCVIMKQENDRLVANGNVIADDMFDAYDIPRDKAFINTGDEDICVYYSDGSFAGVYTKEPDSGIYKVYRLFFGKEQ